MVDGVSNSAAHGGGSWGRWFGCVFLQIILLSMCQILKRKKHRRSGAMYAIACSEKVLLPTAQKRGKSKRLSRKKNILSPIAQKTGKIAPIGQRKFIPLLFKPKISGGYQ
jgi:hypothetical protein